MTDARPALARYDYYLGPKRLGDLWTLKRDALTLRCALSTHRLGWEVRLTSGASFSRTQVCKTESDVYATSETWRADALKQGWKEG
jgi:hypothetical protein